MNKNPLPVLLFSPWLITEAKPALSLLKVSRKDQSVNYSTTQLDWSLVRREFRDYPPPAKALLMDGCTESIEETKRHIKTRYALQRGGVEYSMFASNSFITYWHKIFDSFRPYFPLIKWYNKKEQAGKKTYLTAPCSFSVFKPGLGFDVDKVDGMLRLNINILVNEVSFPVQQFNRLHFLLEAKNEYFILSYQDYQTLDKLQKMDIAVYADQPEAFARDILADLEKQYPVNRNNHFPKTMIVVKPLNRLLLHELNNAFLMLTPQWLYDGCVAEGGWKEELEVTMSGIGHVIKRDKEAEEAFIKILVSLHPNFINQRNGYYYLSFAEAQKKQWFLKAYHQLLGMDIEIAGMDMLNHFRYSPHAPITTMQLLREHKNQLDFNIEVCFGKEKIPLHELQKMLLSGQKAVLLKDGALGVLGDNWLQEYAAIIKHGKIKDNEIEVLRWMAVTGEQQVPANTALRETIKQNWWEKWKQWQSEDREIYPLPFSLQATLRPYQRKGYEWLLLLHEIGAGACLADDMGLGKTVQAICAIMHFIHLHPQSKNIIICPASLIYNWQQEMERFSPDTRVLVYHGTGRQKEQLLQEDIQVIITTYNTMRADADIISGQDYGVAVIDESHNIKNPAAQITQSVMKLKADFRLALSGTPVVNNTFDLYSQLNFVVPGLFGNREFFKREYADPIDNKQEEDKIAALKKLTAPFVLRRTKEQVARDLPDKTESVLWCDMNGLQKAVYEDILQQTRNSIFLEIKSSGLAKSKLSILQGMTRLRQVCGSPMLLPDKDKPACTESIKTDVLMEELDHILGNHKVLVFSQFSSMLHLLADECRKKGFIFYHFDGQTPPAKRTELVNAFQQENNTVNLFLISLKAGNTGLTLTAADYVFLFDPWWNNAVQQQAIDRTHRIGQTKKVFAYKMICKGTIEEKIVMLQQRKKKLSEELISADEGFVKSLTEEDVAYLFS